MAARTARETVEALMPHLPVCKVSLLTVAPVASKALPSG